MSVVNYFPRNAQRASGSASGKRRNPWRASAIAVAVLSFGAQLLSLSTSPASADPSISGDQAQISQIQATINSYNQKLNVLSENYDAAQIRVQQESAQVAAANDKLASDKASEVSTEGILRKEAVTSFIDDGRVSTLDSIMSGGANDIAVKSFYLNVTANQEQSTISSLQAEQRNIAKEQAVYQQALAIDQQSLAQASADKNAALQAQGAEQSLLASVKGNLATLLAQQQAAEQAAREAAAQAAYRSQQQAAAAAQSSGGGDGGSSYQGPNPTAPPVSGAAGIAVRTAYSVLGKPYIWGGEGPDGDDCSGLTAYAWSQAGVSLPHGSIAQYYDTTRISASQLQPGDLVFYSPPGDVALGHVTIYIGGGQVIGADTFGTYIHIQSINYVSDPVGYGRVA